MGGAAAAAPTWTGPVRLSPAARVVTPDLALNAAGDAVVVWNREEGQVCADAPENPACVHVVEASSRALGSAGWEPPLEIARPGVGSGPRVALDRLANAVAVWSHDIGALRVLQASYRRGRSGPWENPIDVSDERFRAATQQVAIDGAGNVIVAWTRFGDAGPVVQARVRDAASGIWGAPVDVSRPDAAVVDPPSLAAGSAGNAVLAWVLATGVVQASVLAGSWQPPVDLGTGAAADVDVALAASGDAAAIWSGLRGASVVVRSASRPAGGDWTAAADVAPVERSTSASPQVGLDPAGTAQAVWVGGGAPALVQAATRPRGAAWSPPAVIAPRDREASAPQLALDSSGNAVAAWTDAEGMTRAAIRPAAGSWQPAVDISGVPSAGVRVAMGAVGAALAVWNRIEPGRVLLEASQLGGTGPVVAHLAVPPTATAGAQVEFRIETQAWAAPLAGDPAWQLGDGASATGRSVRHAYARPGSYDVSVTQADRAGGTSTAEARIVVSAQRPANSARPSIRGRPRVGATLTCHRGAWNGTPPLRFAYRWLRHGRAIARAASSRLRVRPPDRGALITCRVTATNTAGSRAASSRPVRIARR